MEDILLLWVCLFFVNLGTSFGVPKSEAAHKIISILEDPTKYNKNIIPFPNRSGPLEVESTMFIRDLDIDDVNMRLYVDLTFRMSWDDSRLSYSVAGVPNVRFWDVSQFWIPDAFFKDSMTERMKTIHPESYIEVATKERILYSTRLRLNLKCEMNFRRFPHDDQSCAIRVASYGYSTKDVIFAFKSENPVQLASGSVLSDRFRLRNVATRDCQTKTQTGSYSCLEVRLDISRKFSPYFLDWYVPCMCCVAIAFLSELLAPRHILPRLMLALVPLITLMTCRFIYTKHLLPQVPYVTAISVFSGVSFLTIFLVLLHVLLSYYYLGKDDGVKQVSPEGNGVGKWNRLHGQFMARSNFFAKIFIATFYALFVFIYCLAYCLA